MKEYNIYFLMKQAIFMYFLKVLIMQELFPHFLTLIPPEF